MKLLQVLGPGCPKCKKLAENAEAAAKELGIEHRLEKITGWRGQGRRESAIARRDQADAPVKKQKEVAHGQE